VVVIRLMRKLLWFSGFQFIEHAERRQISFGVAYHFY